MASLDYQSPASERPYPDRGPPAASHRPRQLSYVRVDSVQFGERPRNGQRQLRPRTQPGMRRQRAVYFYARAVTDRVMAQEAPGKLPCADGFVTLNFQGVCHAGRHQCRRGGGRRADAAKPAPTVTAQIEDAEMQTRERLDEDLIA